MVNPGKIIQKFFRNFHFRGMSRTNFWKTHSQKFDEYLLNFWKISGHKPDRFLENSYLDEFSRKRFVPRNSVLPMPIRLPGLDFTKFQSFIFYRGRDIRTLESLTYFWFPEIRILWFLFPGLFIFLGNWTIQFFWVSKQKKTFKLRIVFAIYEIDALKRYLYNNNLISAQNPFQKTFNFW